MSWLQAGRILPDNPSGGADAPAERREPRTVSTSRTDLPDPAGASARKASTLENINVATPGLTNTDLWTN